MADEIKITTPDGRLVIVGMDDAAEEVTARTSTGEKIGGISFTFYQDDYGHGQGQEYYLITGLDLEGPNGSRAYLRQGVGRQCIELLASYGIAVVARRPDGQQYDDGSHLTGDGPAFIEQMVKEGLVSWDGGEWDE